MQWILFSVVPLTSHLHTHYFCQLQSQENSSALSLQNTSLLPKSQK